MTQFLEVLTNYCTMYVDDIRLEELANEDVPLYCRKLNNYFKPAIALFNCPSAMQEFLKIEQDSKYDDYEYKVEQEQTSDIVITLGDEYKGYELFACRIRTTDQFGNIVMNPTNIAVYDSENGTITISASVESPILSGTIFDFDFYTDGKFKNTLSPVMMNILGKCFQVIWLERFGTDWLSNVTKIEDKTFIEQNRANKINADTAKLKAAKNDLSIEMRRFAENIAYRKYAIGNYIGIH